MTITDTTRLVGADLLLAAPPAGSRAGSLWHTYVDEFDGFCGARLDPQFSRFGLPDLPVGVPLVPDGTVVIVGAGPSLREHVEHLRRIRQHVSLWTSLRGAEALAHHGLTPDLAIIQHPSDLDAYMTARHLRDRDGRNALDRVPAILLERRTPRALIEGVARDRLYLVDGAIGWGLWVATLAALACESGAAAVVLLGVDLGREHTPDPAASAARSLLSRVAELTRGGVLTVDAGLTGSLKTGWTKLDLRAVPTAPADLNVMTVGRETLAARLDELAGDLRAAAPLLAACREALELTRARSDTPERPPRLVESWAEIAASREPVHQRRAVQDGLGAALLPAMWRRAPEHIPGPLWRPLRLASEEIVRLSVTAVAVLATAGEEAPAA